jgi:hypothetical protein
VIGTVQMYNEGLSNSAQGVQIACYETAIYFTAFISQSMTGEML